MKHTMKEYIDSYFTTLIKCCEQNSFNEFDEYRIIVLDETVSFNARTGLCLNLKRFAHHCGFLLDGYKLNVLFTKYPNFSGSVAYPVKGDLGHGESYDYCAMYRISMYDQETRYGRERLDLIKFIYSELMKCHNEVFDDSTMYRILP